MGYAYSLASADVWVDDVRAALRRMERGFGLGGAGNVELSRFPAYGVEWVFYPVEPTGVATTKLEVIGTDRDAVPDRNRADYPHMVEFGVEQGARSARFHALVIKTLALDDLLERLRSRGARFRLDPATPQIPRPRLFMGFDQDGGAAYDPGFDGGLRLEFWEPYPHERPASPPVARRTRAIPAPFYIEARAMLVADVKNSIDQLERFYGWEPVRTWTAAGEDAAEWAFDDPGSSLLQVVSPASAHGRLARELGRCGSGAWVIRFADSDLRARRDALSSAGMRFVEQTASDGSGRKALWVDLAESGEGLYEFVEQA